ncbi:DUF688 domain-containing protein [Gossypium australe]|uniref:DUF688 domain-containing protein n=1 Tax=Gossypium australe TaxID=47621 RepID=A0A5B6WDR9_9ROSI|nr:DUF688 domain-containing protein [Gossypium australe]
MHIHRKESSRKKEAQYCPISPFLSLSLNFLHFSLSLLIPLTLAIILGQSPKLKIPQSINQLIHLSLTVTGILPWCYTYDPPCIICYAMF